MSRQLISRANQLYYGRACFPANQADKPGAEAHMYYRWKPASVKAFTTLFSGALAAGASSGTLNTSWAGPSGILPITFSDGEVLNGIFTNGGPTCPFLPASFPQQPTVASGDYGNGNKATLVNAVTAAASVGAIPPALGVSNTVSASQSVSASALINGASATGGVATLDVARNVIAAWTTTAIITVTGTDIYGQAQTEASASGTSFTGKKAFATVTGIAVSTAVTAFTAGTGSVLGFPFRAISGDFFSPMLADAADAGTFVAADQTPTATASTGDVRGTYAPSGALNGAKYVAALIKVNDPSTKVGMVGVTPA